MNSNETIFFEVAIIFKQILKENSRYLSYSMLLLFGLFLSMHVLKTITKKLEKEA